MWLPDENFPVSLDIYRKDSNSDVLTKKENEPILDGCLIYLLGFTKGTKKGLISFDLAYLFSLIAHCFNPHFSEDLSFISEQVTSSGGCVVSSMREATHVIVDPNWENELEIEESVKAQYVTVKWLFACQKEKKIVSTQNFEGIFS